MGGHPYPGVDMIMCARCGSCCTDISISSTIPGTGRGKRAGERCVHLTPENLCGIFMSPERPRVCGSFPPDATWCGRWAELEKLTKK